MKSIGKTEIIRLLIIVHQLLVVSVECPYVWAQDSVNAARPNIIWIMADDMGYGDAGCYGQKFIKTPSIDSLAASGIRFTQAYAGAPVCAPSRSVLMTGQHTGHTTVRGNFGKTGGVIGLGGGQGRVPLRESDVTVAHILRKAGYATALAGKWGLGEPNTSGEPLKMGFDHFFGFLNQRRAHNHFPEYLWLDNAKFDLPGNSGNDHPSQYAHDLFSSFAMNFVRKNVENPFFLYLSFTVPHAGFDVPDTSKYDSESWNSQEKAYAAMITRMDSHIGALVALLENLGIRNNTIIFFCSDNGAADRYEGVFDSSGFLRGRKRDMYEGGIRTPMIVSWPSVIIEPRVDPTPWYFADFLPTAAAVAGAVVPDSVSIDGIDISPTFFGKPVTSAENRPLYWEFHERAFQQAARRGPWKFIRTAPSLSPELYNLVTDPSESENIADIYPGIVSSFVEFLNLSHTPSPEFPAPVD